jgi:hypothetical protein
LRARDQQRGRDPVRTAKVVVCLFVSGLVAVSAHAQVLYTLQSPNPESYADFGISVAGAGDVNNDGYADVVVGAYEENGNTGRAYVFSGATGGLLYTFASPNPTYLGRFGWSVSGAGDVNNDGHADVLIGANEEHGGADDAGRAYLYSGRTGGLLHTLVSPNPEVDGYLGWHVSDAGDVNNDGYPDVVVGAYTEDGGATDAGRAYVFSGQTGAPLDTLQSPNPESGGRFGVSVSGAGDVNDDGYADVIVGAHYEASYAGRAYVFSGQTGDTLYSLMSPGTGGNFGTAVSDAGDVNNDGDPDLVVGASSEYSYAGAAYVFSGPTGTPLHSLQSLNPEYQGRFGVSVSGAGDVDNDGHADVVVGAWLEDGGADEAGRAYVFSGATGAALYTLLSPNPASDGYLGRIVSGAGYVDNDSYADVIVGAHGESGGATSAGRAYVFDGDIVPVELASFTTSVVGGAVRLAWVTQSESHNLGFYVYRAAPTEYEHEYDYEYDCLTSELIPGAGSSATAVHYSHVDESVETGRTYYYKLADVSFDGVETHHGPVSVTVPASVPAELGLTVGPWNGSQIDVELIVPSVGRTDLGVYDLAGRQAAAVVEGVLPAGRTSVAWDGTDRRGAPLPSGTYLFRLTHGPSSVTQRVVLAR